MIKQKIPFTYQKKVYTKIFLLQEYPFTKQLIQYAHDQEDKKLGMLILDVKGNYHQKVLEFAKQCNRQDDVITIELNGKYTYNPLDKPNLKPSILANRLKTILLLFSQNN